jgi:hypothetical protein
MAARKNLIERRPAESATTVAGAVVALLVLVLKLDSSYAAPLIVVVGALPAAVTWLVELLRR